MKIYIVALLICIFDTKASVTNDTKFEILQQNYIITDAKEFQYQVSLKSNSKYFCGGTIISYRFILTSASCVYDKKHEKITAFYELGEPVEIEYIKIHDDYGTKGINIALLRTKEDFKIESINLLPIVWPNDRSGQLIFFRWDKNSRVCFTFNTELKYMKLI